MKLSTLILVCAGMALAKKGSGDKTNGGKGTGATSAQSNSTAVNNYNNNSNLTALATNNSSTAITNTTLASSNNFGSNTNVNAGALTGQENGAACISVDALNNVNAADVNLAMVDSVSDIRGAINLQDPLSIAEGIVVLMDGFCLGQTVDLNALLGLGIDDEANIFLELAQLAQLESLGFLNGDGVQSLVESNLLFNGNGNVFNLAGVKREVGTTKAAMEDATARRSKIRRTRIKGRSCNATLNTGWITTD
ncbi:hypothetical protein M406DRAFT_328951 [Cryphonectria parasitica EP155]|uniref:Uncharacterized protein n=1 Tax=Cryphonectria parasitica (strain ATCC 38755 / EP155) TaxID=660469 RepID=A0A9P5CS89_CRYP1|nr:uncharacterized protein M406DRAFT_328951 [Cryphonectria parasitica EP155]KAF3767900.1 hypothetical protein M406DRAFT_328951 [Cryphonectria parasitica EP155]